MSYETLDPFTITKYWKKMQPPNLTQLRLDKTSFKDPYFPPHYNSLFSLDDKKNFTDKVNGSSNQKRLNKNGLGANIKWKRITSITPEWASKTNWEVFTDNKIKCTDVKQGQLGDCYFISSLTVIAEYPYLIAEKFRTREFNDEGYYEMILFIDGEWQIVFVDDWFPVDRRVDNLAFAKPRINALWPILLEKAWAKVNGGFSNIICGYVSDPIFALTRFPTIRLDHQEISKEDLLSELNKSQHEGIIRTASSKDDETIDKEKIGIVPGHAYSILCVKSWEDIHLLKLRNPWGNTEWKGDYAPNSPIWTYDLKKHFGEVKKYKGIFYIDIDNYLKYYEVSNLCYLSFGSVIKSFHFNSIEHFASPLVFNIKINEQSQTAISIIFKHWRFNRKMHNAYRPFSVLLGQYDENREIVQLYTSGTFKDDCSLVETMKPGDYILWICCYYESIRKDKKFKYTLSITSKEGFEANYIGLDKDYSVMKRIAVSHYKNSKRYEGMIREARMKEENVHWGNDEVLYKAKIRGYLIFNLTNSWLGIDLTVKNNDMELLPPYKNESQFHIDIPPLMNCCVFAVGKFTKKHPFDIAKRYTILKSHQRQWHDNTQSLDEYFNHTTLSRDSSLLDTIRQSNYSYITKEKALSFNEVDNSNDIIDNHDLSIQSEMMEYESLVKDYPEEMQQLSTLKSIYDDALVSWEKIEDNQGLYIGETKIVNSNEQHGRGCLKWKNGRKYIGYWKDGKCHGEGKCYYSNGKIEYEGYYETGERHGKGKYYFEDGEMLEIIFTNGRFKEEGIYKTLNDSLLKMKYHRNDAITKDDKPTLPLMANELVVSIGRNDYKSSRNATVDKTSVPKISVDNKERIGDLIKESIAKLKGLHINPIELLQMLYQENNEIKQMIKKPNHNEINARQKLFNDLSLNIKFIPQESSFDMMDKFNTRSIEDIHKRLKILNEIKQSLLLSYIKREGLTNVKASSNRKDNKIISSFVSEGIQCLHNQLIQHSNSLKDTNLPLNIKKIDVNSINNNIDKSKRKLNLFKEQLQANNQSSNIKESFKSQRYQLDNRTDKRIQINAIVKEYNNNNEDSIKIEQVKRDLFPNEIKVRHKNCKKTISSSISIMRRSEDNKILLSEKGKVKRMVLANNDHSIIKEMLINPFNILLDSVELQRKNTMMKSMNLRKNNTMIKPPNILQSSYRIIPKSNSFNNN